MEDNHSQFILDAFKNRYCNLMESYAHAFEKGTQFDYHELEQRIKLNEPKVWENYQIAYDSLNEDGTIDQAANTQAARELLKVDCLERIGFQNSVNQNGVVSKNSVWCKI